MKYEKVYDCVIMGAGFAGNCLARHLMLNIPGIKVALIDPRPEERSDRDLKVGESMVEIAALFISKELGLLDYMIENHPPKAGLNFHWPKDPKKTESKEDYYSIWQAFNNNIPQFQMNRAKFERDLLRMNKEMGVDFHRGHVIDVDLTPGDELNGVTVKGERGVFELGGQHVVDAAGRKFLIGKRKDNLVTDPDKLFGVSNASAWVRVRNIDRSIFDDGHHSKRASASFYYSTNHWCGHGHWVWMIPCDKNNDELSIGLVCHKDKFDPQSVNRKDKFLSFLESNHKVLYKLIQSGEIVDFHWRPQLAYSSKQLFHRDNWYVVGDAAFIFDALYSVGTSSIALLLESITEIIRAKRAGEPDAEEKRELYNRFNLVCADVVNGFYREMTNTLGNASIMGWRIFLESMLWFGSLVPMYVGRWHLESAFVKQMIPMLEELNHGLLADLYADLSEMAQEGCNLGFVDPTRTDGLIKGYLVARQYDDFIVNTKFEAKQTNVFKAVKNTNLYIMMWYWKLHWRRAKMRGVLRPKTLRNFARLSKYALGGAVGDVMYTLSTLRKPNNTEVESNWREFGASYRYQQTLQPWTAEGSRALTAEK